MEHLFYFILTSFECVSMYLCFSCC